MGTRNLTLMAPERVYRGMLLLYPPGFRRRFGPEMLQVFRDSYPRHGRDVSHTTRLALWRWAASDLLRSLPGQWGKALVRPRSGELPFRRWADAFVVPFTVFGYLFVEGNLGALLVRSPGLLPTAHACGGACNAASMVTTSMAIGFCLGVLGTLSAIIAGRISRVEGWWIKL